MIEVKKLESARKVEYAKEIVNEMMEQGIAVTPYTVWKRSGLSKAFLYLRGNNSLYMQNKNEKKYNYKSYTPRIVLQERVEQLKNSIIFNAGQTDHACPVRNIPL